VPRLWLAATTPECWEAHNYHTRHSQRSLAAQHNPAAQHNFAAQQKLAVQYYLNLSTYNTPITRYPTSTILPSQEVEPSQGVGIRVRAALASRRTAGRRFPSLGGCTEPQLRVGPQGLVGPQSDLERSATPENTSGHELSGTQEL